MSYWKKGAGPILVAAATPLARGFAGCNVLTEMPMEGSGNERDGTAMTTTDPSDGALGVAELRDLVDSWYLELLSLSLLEADAALLRAAHPEADILFVRTKAMRSENRAGTRTVSRELDPLLTTLRSQTTLLQRAGYLRRAKRA